MSKITVYKLEVDGGDEVRLMGIFSSASKAKAAIDGDFHIVARDDDVELREASESERGDFTAIYYPAFKDAPSDLSMMDAMGEYMFLQYRVTEYVLDKVVK